MRKFLCDKVVVITGASSGIGEAMSREYSKMGAKVVMAARREEELRRIATDIAGEGGSVAYVACDVTKEDECRKIRRKYLFIATYPLPGHFGGMWFFIK